MRRPIIPPPSGLEITGDDPTFAFGPWRESPNEHGVVERWRECADLVDGRWEGFVVITKRKKQ